MLSISILYPLLALVSLTGLVMLLIPITRFRAGARREVKINDFKYGESVNVPTYVSIPNRNYMNLLEAPTLFYVACIVLFVTTGVTQVAVTIAWAYVFLRLAHSVIHLSYNRVMHRLVAFALSNAVLVALWVVVGVHVLSFTGK